ncbi:DUF6011 domain-containing protein [Arthrobacter sp.]|uniref:DUF6011 domain-containing protein n=1 Tax=Arthrobacter sp. TaxID=1667 RepID=UPI0033991CF8
MDFAELKAIPASDAEMAMVLALGTEVGIDPYSLLAAKSAGDRLTGADVSYVMTLMTARKRFMPVKPPVPAPATPTLPPASAAQLRLLTSLGQAVTGDGAAYVRDLLAKGGAATTSAASAEITRLKSLQPAARPARPAPALRPLVMNASGHPTTNAPAGRYAVQLPGTDSYSLFQVNKPTSGPWAGSTFVVTVPITDGLAQEPVRGQQAVLILNAIEANPRGSAGMYGRVTGKCGLCNRRLSDPTSKSLGIGPECMTRLNAVPSQDAPVRQATGAQAPERF